MRRIEARKERSPKSGRWWQCLIQLFGTGILNVGPGVVVGMEQHFVQASPIKYLSAFWTLREVLCCNGFQSFDFRVRSRSLLLRGACILCSPSFTNLLRGFHQREHGRFFGEASFNGDVSVFPEQEPACLLPGVSHCQTSP